MALNNGSRIANVLTVGGWKGACAIAVSPQLHEGQSHWAVFPLGLQMLTGSEREIISHAAGWCHLKCTSENFRATTEFPKGGLRGKLPNTGGLSSTRRGWCQLKCAKTNSPRLSPKLVRTEWSFSVCGCKSQREGEQIKERMEVGVGGEASVNSCCHMISLVVFQNAARTHTCTHTQVPCDRSFTKAKS